MNKPQFYTCRVYVRCFTAYCAILFILVYTILDDFKLFYWLHYYGRPYNSKDRHYVLMLSSLSPSSLLSTPNLGGPSADCHQTLPHDRK